MFSASLRTLKSRDDEKRKVFLESWKQTMDELDLRTKELVMYGFKLDIEDKMRKKVPDLKTFDNMRFDLRDKYDKVIVTGRCVDCRRILIGEIDILEFIESYNSTRDHNTYTNCKGCQTGKMIIDKI